MVYHVAFMERTGASGVPSEDPTGYLDLELPEGVVLSATPIERTEPLAMHEEGTLENAEDDGFLSIGSELWEYEVDDERRQEFEEALVRSGMVMEFVVVEEGPSGSES